MFLFKIRSNTWWKQKKFDDKEFYKELRGDVEGTIGKFIIKIIRKLRNRGEICHDILHYVSINNPKLRKHHFILQDS